MHKASQATATCSHKGGALLGFISVNGEPILHVLIFAAMGMWDEWILRFDPFVEWIAG